MPPAPPGTGTVRSADGTAIGYRQLGHGPGLVLVHGGLQASQNLLSLASALSDRLTVYIPDRRGRGLSGPYRPGHGMRTEIGDLQALLGQTAARYVFGVSAGAVIALETARSSPSITKLALYEPPLSFDGVSHTAWVPRYERELAAGKLPSALVTIIKATADRTAPRCLPRFLLTSLLALAINRGPAKPAPPATVTLPGAIPGGRAVITGASGNAASRGRDSALPGDGEDLIGVPEAGLPVTLTGVVCSQRHPHVPAGPPE